MIRDFVMWLLKIFMQMILWIFLLSIEWDNRSIYDRGYDILVDNPVVELLNSQAQELWKTVSETARVTYSEISKTDKETKG